MSDNSGHNPFGPLRGEQRAGLPGADAVRSRGQQRQRNSTILRASGALAAVALAAVTVVNVLPNSGDDNSQVIANPAPQTAVSVSEEPTETTSGADPVSTRIASPPATSPSLGGDDSEPTRIVPTPDTLESTASEPTPDNTADPELWLLSRGDLPRDQGPWTEVPRPQNPGCIENLIPKSGWTSRSFAGDIAVVTVAGRRADDRPSAEATMDALRAGATACYQAAARQNSTLGDLEISNLEGADEAFLVKYQVSCPPPEREQGCGIDDVIFGAARVFDSIVLFHPTRLRDPDSEATRLMGISVAKLNTSM